MKRTILLAEDDPAVRTSLEMWLQHDGWELTVAEDGQAARDLFHARPTAVVLTDLMMPRLDGIGLLMEIREMDPDTPVVVLTGFATIDKCREALKAGAMDFLEKPCRLNELRQVLNRAWEKRQQYRAMHAIRKGSVQNVDFRLPADLNQRLAALEQVMALVTAAGFSWKTSVIRLAVDEALANAILHGCGNDPQKEIRVTGRFEAGRAVITVQDPGPGFDLAVVAETPFDDKPGGRGIFLIRSFCDEVNWRERNTICEMIFHHPENPKAEATQ